MPRRGAARLPTPPVRILIGRVAGLATGVVFGDAAIAPAMLGVARPIGKGWLDALTMTVVPLVFALLVTGIMQAAQAASGGRVAARAIGWFALLLLAATLLAAATTTLLLQVVPLPPGATALRDAAVSAAVTRPGTDWLDAIIPTNPIRAAADTAMVPLVVFALLFGLAASGIEPGPRAALTQVLTGVAQAMLRIVAWVLLVAPIGVFTLALSVGARMGGGALSVLAHYVFVVIATCLCTTALCYAAVAVFGRMSPIAFARAALPAQVIALSTQSSLGSLPAMVAAAAPLGLVPATAGIVLPLAVSLFRAASAAANVAVAIYLAQVHAVPLGIPAVALGAVIAAAVSVAAVGLPAQVSFFAVIAPVCLAMGVPVGLLPVLLAIETLPDIFRTLGNVTADLAVTRIVGRSDGLHDQPQARVNSSSE